VTAAPSLAGIVASGLVEPGGPELGARLVEGLGVGPADRVVEIAPGYGVTAERVLKARPGSYVGVDPDPVAVMRLRERLGGPGRSFREAPVDATGLEGGSASAVVVSGLLSRLPAEGKDAVIAEAARLLRSGGRLAVHEVALAIPADEADPEEAERRLLADIAADGTESLHPLTPDGWKALLAERLVPVGMVSGPLSVAPARDLLRGIGLKPTLAMAKGLLGDAGERSEGAHQRTALELNARWLGAVVIVAEKPLIFDLRRPRYS
jgi:SAM-dependent methyltransferase